jgi:adenosylhomocysteine nucleosidase
LKKLGVIVAMDKELAQLRSLLDEATTERHNQKDFVIGKIGDHEVVLQQCGIGKVNSAIGAVEMIDNYHPDLIISTGCAGGADSALNPLDVVVASACVYHDVYCGDNASYGQVIGMPPTFKADADLVEKALTVKMPEGGKIVKGLTVSGDWFVDSRQKMQGIIDKFPNATAVDMESCSIAQACLIYKTPFISFRVISDVPLKDTKASQYFDFWNRVANDSFMVTRSFIELID